MEKIIIEYPDYRYSASGSVTRTIGMPVSTTEDGFIRLKMTPEFVADMLALLNTIPNVTASSK